ncbi:cysteine rich repeat-containing protein [Geomonas sp.]|uniref:cysteine rich repeat-containing protein n=1 Tax=Geomonas sp. TaxID=2651584 RepID=UPI002B483F69|nr:cysteine rich repeat-containing protein [Geomonas sp.]HJV36253.1 cysteine rich repeat-containing protein [Geomonas sp.]
MKGNSIASVVCWTLAGAVLAFTPVRAQGVPACGEEIEKFCSHVVPGKLGLALCLQEHRDELGPECQAKVDKAMAKVEQARKICGPDLAKFCAGVKPGEGRLLLCLSGKRSELAPECRAQVETVLGKMKGAAPATSVTSATPETPAAPATAPPKAQ